MADFYSIQTQTGWRRALEIFADWCKPARGWRALDVGCGPGLFPALLRQRGCRAFGVDLDLSLLQRHWFDQPLAQADARRLPYPSAIFDLVTASNLLFFLAEPEEALSEMARLVRPGGQVCLLNPSENLTMAGAELLANRRNIQGVARSSLLEWARRAESHRRWTVADLERLYARAGLRLFETALGVGPNLARFARGINPA